MFCLNQLSGSSKSCVKIGKPRKPETTQDLTCDGAFWIERDNSIMTENCKMWRVAVKTRQHIVTTVRCWIVLVVWRCRRDPIEEVSYIPFPGKYTVCL